ncbi:MAG TPA: hypothetical protein VNY52_05265 [Solirubrobacteraceae bacterium]|nr:hypothetical protein [Solirubrobacteraceae bacterium]
MSAPGVGAAPAGILAAPPGGLAAVRISASRSEGTVPGGRG